jgi:hypothetical protein
MQRRLRIVDSAPRTDASGAKFVSFFIDERRNGQWTVDVMSGCAYLESGAVFVKQRGKLRPAGEYFGEGAKDHPGAPCVAATVIGSLPRSRR